MLPSYNNVSGMRCVISGLRHRRDFLVRSNERVAAELVESAIQTLEDACRVLLARERVS